MRILITGATGFIGRRLIPLLHNNNEELLLISRKKINLIVTTSNIHIIYDDLKNLDKFKKIIVNFNPDILIHLAWEGIPDFSFEMCRTNLINSLNLMNLVAYKTNCRKIIVSGSSLEYGKTNGQCHEKDKIKITSDFTWAKQSLYNYCEYVCTQEKINLIWFRFFYVYGQGQREASLIPSLIKTFKKKLPLSIKTPFAANDFIHIDDISRGIKAAVEKNIPSGIYNLGSGKATKIHQIAATVEKFLTGRDVQTKKLLKQAKLTDRVSFWADTKKTKECLGWNALIKLNSGIKEMC